MTPGTDSPVAEMPAGPTVAEWFNSSGRYSRTRALSLWPSGQLTYSHRATPADVWSAPETVGLGCTLPEARIIAERLALTAAR